MKENHCKFGDSLIKDYYYIIIIYVLLLSMFWKMKFASMILDVKHNYAQDFEE